MSRETRWLLRVMNTVVPSVRRMAPDFSFARKRSASAGVCVSSECMVSMPLRHVVITKKMSAARVSGSHPPSSIFKRLALKKERSTMKKNPPVRTATMRGPRPTPPHPLKKAPGGEKLGGGRGGAERGEKPIGAAEGDGGRHRCDHQQP